MGNVVLFCIFGLIFGWMGAHYSIIFQFISTKTISSFHRYESVTLQITTEKAEQVMKAYVGQYRHGISCVEAVGGWQRAEDVRPPIPLCLPMRRLDIVALMREADPHVIVNQFKTTQFYGKFYQRRWVAGLHGIGAG